MEVTAGLRDEYSRINRAANSDILNMYLNYDGGSSGVDTSLDPGHKSDTPTLDSMYGGMVARDVLGRTALSTAVNRGVSAGIGSLVTGSLPSIESVLDPASLGVGFASRVPGAIMSQTLGLDKGYNKVGSTVGGMAGSLLGGPVGGMMGSMFGRVAASGAMDAFGLREDEDYLDFMEDEYGWLRAQQLYSQQMDPRYQAMLGEVTKSYFATPPNMLAYDASYTPGYVQELGTPATAEEYGMPYSGYELDFNTDIGDIGGYSDPMAGFDDGWGDLGSDDPLGLDSGLDSSFGEWGESETDTAFGDNDGFGMGWW